MNNKKTYDKTNPLSIEEYAQGMVGKTFREISDADKDNDLIVDTKEYETSHEDKNYKGGLGNIIEERFFHYKSNSESRADFEEAGVELKVTPYKKSRGKMVAKERLVLSMIDFNTVVNETFETSHLWEKTKLMLLVYYEYNPEAESKMDYKIQHVKLFSPPDEDLKIIREDFEKIVSKIREGRAHELSEGDTLYLGAATKSSDSSKRRSQPFSEILAKPRAFSFKNSYMTHVLNNYIIPGKNTCESILKQQTTYSFEDYVVNRIKEYVGVSVAELCTRLDVNPKKHPKNLEALLAYRMLGIKSNRAEEFEKANVVVKAIRIGKNNKIKENMSFPAFKFKELVEEQWEDSTFGNYLRETRFLFVVYKEDSSGVMRLVGSQFWNMPVSDIENGVREVWERTKQVLIDGLVIEVINGKNHTNLPKISESDICHVRPHAKDTNDIYELPDGRQFAKQCFWLNNSYILEQLNDEFKEDNK